MMGTCEACGLDEVVRSCEWCGGGVCFRCECLCGEAKYVEDSVGYGEVCYVE